MKKVYIIFVIVGAISIIGCTKFPDEKKLVKEQIQSFQESQLDLNVKFKEFDTIKTITYQDSLNYLLPIYSNNLEINASNFINYKMKSDSIITYNKLMEDTLVGLKVQLDDLYKLYDDGYNRDYSRFYSKKRQETQNKIRQVENYRLAFQLSTDTAKEQIEILSKYGNAPKTVIGMLYKVKFDAFNPFLNADQTVDTYFLINMNTKFVMRLNDYGK